MEHTKRSVTLALLLCCLAPACLADSCAPDCKGSSALLPHPQDCSKFYQCSYGAPHLQSCPAGLHFSTVSSSCNYPAQAGCTADPTAECESDQATEGPAPPADSNTTSTSAPIDECTPACPSPEALFPHPHDCTKYFHCARNVPYLKPCPSGQEYSGPLERCDWPEVAQCTASADSPCVAVTYATSSPESSEKPPAPSDCAPACPWPNAYMPHPQDCSKFYICGGLVAFESNCQAGLHYSMELVRCDYPEVANCIASPDRACDELLS